MSALPHSFCTHLLRLAAGALALATVPAQSRESADSRPLPAALPADSGASAARDPAGLSYADLVDLATRSTVVVRGVVHRQSRLKPEQAPGLKPGFARLYIELQTSAVLIGPDLGESLRLLADVPVDRDGHVAKLTKSPVLIMGHAVAGRPGELLLTAPDTMFAWSQPLETRVRAILTALISPDAPPRVTGLREALHVPGNLAGEGESQFFFTTDNGKPASISVVRRPGEPARWGVSFSEIVDQAASPPAPETLAWYRLACFLPETIPDRAAISDSAADKHLAEEDYALVRRDLGPCQRNHQQ
jgi:hypothetical protein